MKALLFCCILTISVTSAYYLKYFLNDRHPDLTRRLPESNSYAEYLNSIALYKRRLQLLGLYPLISAAEIRRYEEKHLSYGNVQSSSENEVFIDDVNVVDRDSASKENDLNEISNSIEDNSGNFYDNVAMENTQNMVDTNGNSIPSYAIVEGDLNSAIDTEDLSEGDRKPTVLDQVIDSIVQLIVHDPQPISTQPEIVTSMQDSNQDTFQISDNENPSGNEILSFETESISEQDGVPEITNSNSDDKSMDSGIFDLSDNATNDDLIEILDPEKADNDGPSSDEIISSTSIVNDDSIISANDLLHFIDDPTGLELFDEFVTPQQKDFTTSENISVSKPEKYEENNASESDFKQNEIEDRSNFEGLNLNAVNMTEDQLKKTLNFTEANRSIESQLVNIAENEKKQTNINQQDSANQNTELSGQHDQSLLEDTKQVISNTTANQPDLRNDERNLAAVNISNSKLESSMQIQDQLTKPQRIIYEVPSEFKAYEEIPIISKKSVKKPAAIHMPPLDDDDFEAETLENIEAIKRKFEQGSSNFADYEPIYDDQLSKFKVDFKTIEQISLQDVINLDINNTKLEAASLQNKDQLETIVSNDQIMNQAAVGETLEAGIEKTKPILLDSSIRFDDYEPIYDFNDLSKFKVDNIEKEHEKLFASKRNKSKHTGKLLLNSNVVTFETTPLIAELKPLNSGNESELDAISRSSVKANGENYDEKGKLKNYDDHIKKSSVLTDISDPSTKLNDLDYGKADLYKINNISNEQNLSEINLSQDQIYNVLDLKLNEVKPVDKTVEIDIKFQKAGENILLANESENFTLVEEVKDQFDEKLDVNVKTLETISKKDLLLNNSSKIHDEDNADDQSERIEITTDAKNSETSIEDQRKLEILIKDNSASYVHMTFEDKLKLENRTEKYKQDSGTNLNHNVESDFKQNEIEDRPVLVRFNVTEDQFEKTSNFTEANRSIQNQTAAIKDSDDELVNITENEKKETKVNQQDSELRTQDDQSPLEDTNQPDLRNDEQNFAAVNISNSKLESSMEIKDQLTNPEHVIYEVPSEFKEYEEIPIILNKSVKKPTPIDVPPLDDIIFETLEPIEDQREMAKDETFISNEQVSTLDKQTEGGEPVEAGIDKTKSILEHSSIRFDDYEPIYDFNDLSKFKVDSIEKENEKLISSKENKSQQFDPLTSDVDLDVVSIESTPPNSVNESELDDISSSNVNASAELINENYDVEEKLKNDDNHIKKIDAPTKSNDEITIIMDLDDGKSDLSNISNSLNEQSILKKHNLSEISLSQDQVYNVLDLKLDKVKPVDKTDEIDIKFQNENITLIEEVKDQFDEKFDINDKTLETIPKNDLLLSNSSKIHNEENANDQNKMIETNDFYEPSQLLHDNEEAIDNSRNSFEEEITKDGKKSETSIEEQRRSDILIEDNFDSYDDNADYSIMRDSDAIFEPRANKGSDLVQLIPFVIEQYRRGAISKLEEDTLAKSMGELWPLIQAEVKRKPNEEMNSFLAMLLNSTEKSG